MQNKIQLITYIDRLGCSNLKGLQGLLKNEFRGLFGGVHILPFYFPIDGKDAGFDPIDHRVVDPRLGDWNDIKELSRDVDIMADLIVNHVSAQSEQFLDYLRMGSASAFSSMFLSFDSVFPDGASESDLLSIYRPRPGFPFTTFRFNDNSEKLIWTTFTENQVDIDVSDITGKEYLENILEVFRKSGIKIIRLDAAGYAVKKKGTSCFMIQETFDFIDNLTKKAHEKGIEVLVEIHSYYKTQIEIARKVDFVYDFALPVLILDSLFNKNTDRLKNWLRISPRNALTVLDTHDGIGIIDVASEGDNPGLVDTTTLSNIVDRIHANSNGQSLKATGNAASNLDLYQVNCTYYDALGRNDKDYLIARAIQFFAPGVPQVYYMGFLCCENDMELLSRTQVGRDINRHYLTLDELQDHLQKPVVKNLQKIMKLRNNHPAFHGQFSLANTDSHKIQLRWDNAAEWAELNIDLQTMIMSICFSDRNEEDSIHFS